VLGYALGGFVDVALGAFGCEGAVLVDVEAIGGKEGLHACALKGGVTLRRRGGVLITAGSAVTVQQSCEDCSIEVSAKCRGQRAPWQDTASAGPEERTEQRGSTSWKGRGPPLGQSRRRRSWVGVGGGLGGGMPCPIGRQWL